MKMLTIFTCWFLCELWGNSCQKRKVDPANSQFSRNVQTFHSSSIPCQSIFNLIWNNLFPLPFKYFITTTFKQFKKLIIHSLTLTLCHPPCTHRPISMPYTSSHTPSISFFHESSHTTDMFLNFAIQWGSLVCVYTYKHC